MVPDFNTAHNDLIKLELLHEYIQYFGVNRKEISHTVDNIQYIFILFNPVIILNLTLTLSLL